MTSAIKKCVCVCVCVFACTSVSVSACVCVFECLSEYVFCCEHSTQSAREPSSVCLMFRFLDKIWKREIFYLTAIKQSLIADYSKFLRE
jgi:hypothetical protein